MSGHGPAAGYGKSCEPPKSPFLLAELAVSLLARGHHPFRLELGQQRASHRGWQKEVPTQTATGSKRQVADVLAAGMQAVIPPSQSQIHGCCANFPADVRLDGERV